MDRLLVIDADGAAPDGAALLGLGYGSDADSQDSGASGQAQRPRAVKVKAGAGHQGSRASQAESPRDTKAALGGSLSPKAGGWVKEEEEEQKADQALPIFVKGQR